MKRHRLKNLRQIQNTYLREMGGLNFSIPTFLFNYVGGYEDKIREEPSGQLVNYVYSNIGSWRDIIGNDMVAQGSIPGGPGLKIPNFKEPYRSIAGFNIIPHRPIYYGRTPSGQTAWNNFQSKIKGFGINSTEASKLYAATDATGIIYVNPSGKIVTNAYTIGASFYNVDVTFIPTIMLPVSNAQDKVWQTTLQSKVIFDYGITPVLQNKYNEQNKK